MGCLRMSMEFVATTEPIRQMQMRVEHHRSGARASCVLSGLVSTTVVVAPETDGTAETN
jgi:hypothetical protein